MNGPDRLPWRSLLQASLLAAPAAAAVRDDPNRPLLASLLAGQAAGEGCLPPHLGLGEARHAAMLATYFPGCHVITSYSIHYTKLYEGSGQRLAIDDLDLVTGRIAKGVPGRLSLTTHVRGKKPLVDLAVALDGTYRVITSYSIHYTKLYECRLRGQLASARTAGIVAKGG